MRNLPTFVRWDWGEVQAVRAYFHLNFSKWPRVADLKYGVILNRLFLKLRVSHLNGECVGKLAKNICHIEQIRENTDEEMFHIVRFHMIAAKVAETGKADVHGFALQSFGKP